MSKVLEGLKKTGKVVGEFSVGALAFIGGFVYVLTCGYAELAKEEAKNNYSGAIKAIMDSGMSEYRKSETIEMLLKGASSEYYKSVMEIVKSNMSDYRKTETIEYLSKNEENESE